MADNVKKCVALLVGDNLDKRGPLLLVTIFFIGSFTVKTVSVLSGVFFVPNSLPYSSGFSRRTSINIIASSKLSNNFLNNLKKSSLAWMKYKSYSVHSISP